MSDEKTDIYYYDINNASCSDCSDDRFYDTIEDLLWYSDEDEIFEVGMMQKLPTTQFCIKDQNKRFDTEQEAEEFLKKNE